MNSSAKIVFVQVDCEARCIEKIRLPNCDKRSRGVLTTQEEGAVWGIHGTTSDIEFPAAPLSPLLLSTIVKHWTEWKPKHELGSGADQMSGVIVRVIEIIMSSSP
jgi:hypothetical protein